MNYNRFKKKGFVAIFLLDNPKVRWMQQIEFKFVLKFAQQRRYIRKIINLKISSNWGPSIPQKALGWFIRWSSNNWQSFSLFWRAIIAIFKNLNHRLIKFRKIWCILKEKCIFSRSNSSRYQSVLRLLTITAHKEQIDKSTVDVHIQLEFVANLMHNEVSLK